MLYSSDKHLDDTWDTSACEVMAQKTIGMTGAEIATIMNEAAHMAARRDSVAIARSDVEGAVKEIIAVVKRRRIATGEQYATSS